MADKELPLDVSTDDKKGGSKMMLIIIVLLVVLIGGGAAAFFLMNDKEDTASEEATAEVHQPPIYLPMRPAFVVNFANVTGKTSFLQVEVSLVGRDPTAMTNLESHMPLVKSLLVNIFSGQDFDELKTPEGKENMREQALEELQTALTEDLGDPTIERILFTKFVLQ